jgi:hypothetical protein
MRHFGPGLRIESSFSQFHAFQKALTRLTGTAVDTFSVASSDSAGKSERYPSMKSDSEGDMESGQEKYRPLITFFGSNDFHHLSLALTRRFDEPFNLVQLLRFKE